MEGKNMACMDFRRFIRLEVRYALHELIDAMGHLVAITDEKKRILYGEDNRKIWTREFEVAFEGEVLGYVMGDPKAFWLPRILNYMVEESISKKRMEKEMDLELERINHLKEKAQISRVEFKEKRHCTEALGLL